MPIHTLSQFDVGLGEAEAFVRAREAQGWASQGDVPPIGVWAVIMGRPACVLALTRYDGMAHWQAATERVRVMPGALQPSEVIGLRPITRRSPAGPAPEAAPGIYTMRTFNVAPENLARFVELSQDVWWPWVEPGQGNRPLGQWTSIVAPHTRVYMITRYDDLAHWEATRVVGPKPDAPELVPIWEAAGPGIAERASLTIDTDLRMLQPIGSRRP